MPYGSWCEHCARGKAAKKLHRAGDGLGASETPVVSVDYAFIGDRSTKCITEDGVVGEEEGNQVEEEKTRQIP